jgi:hypothetical protein
MVDGRGAWLGIWSTSDERSDERKAKTLTVRQEFVCFLLRTLGAFDQQNSTYVIVGTLLFLLSPLCKFHP